MKVPSSSLAFILLGLWMWILPTSGFLHQSANLSIQSTNNVQKQNSIIGSLSSQHSRLLSLLFEKDEDNASCSSSSRRNLLVSLPSFIATQYAISSSILPQSAFAAASQKDNEEKFRQAKTSLQYLVDHYAEISKGGGDNVRRYLGTVVTDAPMVGIMKVLKELQGEADDIVEYTESMDAFEYSLRAADTAVYSANFVTFSSAKTKPEEYFDNAFKELKKMLACMDTMAAELNLK